MKKLKISSELWIVGVLFVFTFVLAYISSLNHAVCIDDAAKPSVWEATSWPMKVVVFQLLLVFALFVFSQSRRFSSPIEYVEDAPRAQTEYVSSMADLVKRAGKHTLVIDTLSKQFKSELRRKLALQPDASDHEILSAMKIQHPELEAQVRNLFQRELDYRSGAAPERLTDIMKWAREIAHIRGNWRRAA